MRPFATLVAAAIAAAASTAANAAPCAGFADIDSTDPFCPNVEWIRNREVTLGCAAGAYCPHASVSRLQMAAFMNRLGTALTPQERRTDAAPGALDLNASVVACQTTPLAVTGFPRTAYLDLAFAAHAPTAIDLAADLVMTLNGGASWVQLTAFPNRGSVPANGWASIANLATVDLDVGQTATFGVRLQRVGGSDDLDDSRCNLRVLVVSRDGAASPF